MQIRLSDLEATVRRINTMTSNPQEPYIKQGDKYVSQVGCYHLSGAYGGYALHQEVLEACLSVTRYQHTCPQCGSRWCGIAACRFSGLTNERAELEQKENDYANAMGKRDRINGPQTNPRDEVSPDGRPIRG